MTDESTPKTLFCDACGAQLRTGARFCKSCGAEVRPATEAEPASKPDEEPVAIDSPATAATAPRAEVNWLVLGAVVLVVALAAVGGIWLFLQEKAEAELQASTVQQYVTRLTRVRDKPTSIGSAVLGDLRRSEAVSGIWVNGADGQTRWLKIKWSEPGEAYVWGANLSSTPLPVLIRELNEKRVVISASQLHALPQSSAPVIEPLSPGTELELAGELADGWLEVTRKSGGVGYVQVSTLAPLFAPGGVSPPAAYGASPALVQAACLDGRLSDNQQQTPADKKRTCECFTSNVMQSMTPAQLSVLADRMWSPNPADRDMAKMPPEIGQKAIMATKSCAIS